MTNKVWLQVLPISSLRSAINPQKTGEYPVPVAIWIRGKGEITRSQRTDLSPHSSWQMGNLGFKSRRPDENFGKRTGSIGHSS
ncbi:MAG: hypothetical protein EBT07_10670 [Actinobacteria bacterium]|nr:hypothetical protein [Actinomycetota bacterium]